MHKHSPRFLFLNDNADNKMAKPKEILALLDLEATTLVLKRETILDGYNALAGV